MGDSLIIITHGYPYGECESFFSSELDFLSHHFKIIYLFPVKRYPKVRQIPKNVILLNEIVNELDLTKKRPIKLLYLLWHNRYFLLEDMRRYKKNINLLIYFHQYLKFCLLSFIVSDILKKVIEITKCSFVYTYWLSSEAVGALILRLKGLATNNFKIVSRAHAYDVYNERSNIGKNPFQFFTIKNIDKIITISDHAKNYLSEIYPSYASKIISSRLGVPKQKILSKPSKDGILRIVSCSEIEKWKRVWLIAHSLSYIKEERIIWTHIGGGKSLKYLECFINKQLSKQKNIKVCLLGQVDHEDVIEYYRNNPVDLFINVSVYEGISVAIMEALSFGIPVIATNIYGTSEIIDQNAGFLINIDSQPFEIAMHILAFNNLSEIEKLNYRKNAYLSWKKYCNSEENYNILVKIFNNTLED